MRTIYDMGTGALEQVDHARQPHPRPAERAQPAPTPPERQEAPELGLRLLTVTEARRSRERLEHSARRG